mmetsp:Transcript_7218/g.18138  ORF Transcript_7218/g.18138 Transcript_7218/m.18138 type:complete len:99 (+) Transcript_7218:212-508(+)
MAIQMDWKIISLKPNTQNVLPTLRSMVIHLRVSSKNPKVINQGTRITTTMMEMQVMRTRRTILTIMTTHGTRTITRAMNPTICMTNRMWLPTLLAAMR